MATPRRRLAAACGSTQRSAQEVGGWNRADRMGLALAVVYGVDRKSYRTYYEQDVDRLLLDLVMADIHGRLRFRLSLAHLSEVNLGESKGGDGLQSLAWWKEGRIDLIEQYCKKDVELTHRIYRLGCDQGFLLYRGRDEQVLRLPVNWGSHGAEV